MNTIKSRAVRAVAAAAVSAAALLLASPPAGAADAPVLSRTTGTTAAAVTHDAMPEAANFTVTLINLSDVRFDEAVVSLSRHSASGVRLLRQTNIGPMTVRQWNLGPCTDVKTYALGVYVGGALVGSTGNVTPNADDGDLCSDEYEIE
ncbi:hypothetical protein [Lentzea sp.]|uniref:hypothetical protein n=1 Tax=Lentzea sp. TaxID=56099 RepID=UPI002C831487|nr:hypothetical protein [Lentzea sp.]HUQ61445.1 hypothetical protein [Lentzea sp.]